MDFYKFLYIVLLVLSLGACSGGGGGGNGTPDGITYVGNADAAVITTTNAARLVANVVGTSEASDVVIPTGAILNSTYGAREASSQSGLAHRLNTYFLDSLDQASSHLLGEIAAAVKVDEIIPCVDGGSVHVTGTINEDGTGNLSATYNNCTTGSETLDGAATIRVDAYDLTHSAITDMTVSFTVMTLTAPSVSISISGSMRDQLNIATNTETLTINMVTRDDLSGEMLEAENLILIGIFDNIFYPSSYSETISGRVYDSVHGYVDVTTASPFVFSSISQLFPDSGQLLLTGAANTSIRVTALSAVLLKLELDLDGDSSYEIVAILKWTELGGAVGVDLGDSDGDGMHNSWEMANGLDPSSSADAALDKDSDGFTNLEEYQAGTDPSNSASAPPSADLAITINDSPDPVAIGSSLTYSITVVNWGPSEAVDVVVTDVLPTGLSLVSATSSSGSCSGTVTITCNLGVLAMGETSWVNLSVTASTEGMHSNTASVSSVTVDGDSSNNTAAETTTVGNSAGSLQDLIDAASPGDTVPVPPGLYVGGVDFSGKDITLTSTAGAASTIIHGNGGTTVSMGPSGTITGFTITGAAGYGSGIRVSGVGSVITGNVITGNSSYFGAAIDGNCASPTIERNIFSYNCNTLTSDAVHFGNCSSPTIVNNIFENNQCRALAVTLPEGYTPLIINNTFVGNTVAIHVWRLVSQSSHTYRNNILVSNGIGLEVEDGSAVDNPVWQNNLVFGNTTDYLGISDQTGLDSNISTDPLFLSADDYHLSTGSPAIDSGNATDAPLSDFDGTSRPLDGDASGTYEFDIGAYEFSPP